MTIEYIIGLFLKVQLAASCAILLTVAIRLPVRRLFGAEIGYMLWLLAPVAGLFALFPSIAEFVDRLHSSPSVAARIMTDLRAPVLAHAPEVVAVWAAGVAVLGALFVFGQWRFDRSARAGRAGPAATGFWPTMVVPSDYADRFTLEERRLIRAHERAHMDRRDPTSNLTIAFLQVISWFNPLAHLAATLARMDQELSIDAKVICRDPAQGPRPRPQFAARLRPGARLASSAGGAPGHARHAQDQREARHPRLHAGGRPRSGDHHRAVARPEPAGVAPLGASRR
jgi:beta-lactamase regulating signal transducer with metallopeptidase domain